MKLCARTVRACLRGCSFGECDINAMAGPAAEDHGADAVLVADRARKGDLTPEDCIHIVGKVEQLREELVSAHRAARKDIIEAKQEGTRSTVTRCAAWLLNRGEGELAGAMLAELSEMGWAGVTKITVATDQERFDSAWRRGDHRETARLMHDAVLDFYDVPDAASPRWNTSGPMSELRAMAAGEWPPTNELRTDSPGTPIAGVEGPPMRLEFTSEESMLDISRKLDADMVRYFQEHFPAKMDIDSSVGTPYLDTLDPGFRERVQARGDAVLAVGRFIRALADPE